MKITQLRALPAGLNARMFWRPAKLVIQCDTGNVIKLGAVPLEQARAVCQRLNLELVVLTRTRLDLRNGVTLRNKRSANLRSSGAKPSYKLS